MLPAGHRPATSWVHYTTNCNTQSSAPEDGQNNCPKYVELTGIINKPLLLHLVACLYYLYQWCTVKHISYNEIYLLIKYIKSVFWRVAKRLSHIEDARCLKIKNRFHTVSWKHTICEELLRALLPTWNFGHSWFSIVTWLLFCLHLNHTSICWHMGIRWISGLALTM